MCKTVSGGPEKGRRGLLASVVYYSNIITALINSLADSSVNIKEMNTSDRLTTLHG